VQGRDDFVADPCEFAMLSEAAFLACWTLSLLAA